MVLDEVLKRGNAMRAAELIMHTRPRTAVCLGEVGEVLTLLDETASSVRGIA
jgi:hypothetical protein